VIALAADAAAVLIFVVIGRHTHGHALDVKGVVSTAWPFWAGLGAGWLVVRGWRQPFTLVPTGAGAVVGTVAVGMALRVLAGQGIATAFVFVALAFIALFLFGWRLLCAGAHGLRERSFEH
jgi:hypothetical protein